MNDDDKTMEIRLETVAEENRSDAGGSGGSPWAGVAVLALLCVTAIVCCGIAAFVLTSGRS